MRTLQKKYKDFSGYYFSQFEISELKNFQKYSRKLNDLNLLPATSGNFSIRSVEKTLLVTRSGFHKGQTTVSDFVKVHMTGKAVSPLAPKTSDETLLHCCIYDIFSDVNAILHCHPKVNDKIKPSKSILTNHEIIKALGCESHESEFTLPVFENSQNMSALSEKIRNSFVSEKHLNPCAFLLENHGIYCFGKNVHDAFHKLEALLVGIT